MRGLLMVGMVAGLVVFAPLTSVCWSVFCIRGMREHGL